MITRRKSASQPAWRREFEQSITDPETLLEILQLDPALLPAARRAASDFPLRVPRSYVARISPGDPHDPLLRQILPLAEEMDDAAGFTADPVNDRMAEESPGVLRKYGGRVLLIASGSCAVNCRYCFRRSFPYPGHTAAAGHWRNALSAIASDSSLAEVILSGGDPLTLSDSVLGELTDGLREIPHVARLRIHTRLPVVLPRRVDSDFCRWLESLPWPVAMVVHVNHAQELDERVADAMAQIRGTGAALLNQSVLLRGINDDPDVLANLSESLFAAGVLPYYLHLLDPVRGAIHFDVPEERAREIMARLSARLPGYLLPRLVREIPGTASKTLIPPFPHNADTEAVPLLPPM